jgi:hypothetical protein
MWIINPPFVSPPIIYTYVLFLLLSRLTSSMSSSSSSSSSSCVDTVTAYENRCTQYPVRIG